MAPSSECTEQYTQKVFDTADIVRDARFRQLPLANKRRGDIPLAIEASYIQLWLV
jgi:hypothetical protein